MARPIKLNASYFSHDADMRNHKKVRALRLKFGATGYAMWCMMLEMLTNSEYFEMDYTPMDIDLMAMDFDSVREEVESIVDYCVELGLLVKSEDGTKIYSPSLKKRLNDVLQKKRKLSNAGKRGMASRYNKSDITRLQGGYNSDITRLQGGYNSDITRLQGGYNSDITKEKETKEEKSKENVSSIVNDTSSNSNESDDAVAVSRREKAEETKKAKGLMDYYNITIVQNGSQLRSCQSLSPKRRGMVLARLKEHGEEKVRLVVDKAVASDFLNYTKKGGPVDIEWIMGPENFGKILEGKYDNGTYSRSQAEGDPKNVNSKWGK